MKRKTRNLVGKSKGRPPRGGRAARANRPFRTTLTTWVVVPTGLVLAAALLMLNLWNTKKKPLLTYGKLGQAHTGRLGNQLFQMAATIGLAVDNGFRYDFLQTVKSIEIGRIFNLRATLVPEDLDRAATISEDSLNFQEFVLPQGAAVVSMDGYLQSPLYFAHHREEITKAFRFKEALLESALSNFPEVEREDTVCLHVRRGDYIQLRHIYTQLDLSYYSQALSEFENVSTVVVFSNEAEWCREEFGNLPYVFKFSSLPHEQDFAALSRCRKIIIANSSFSWWAAFMGHNRPHVVAPRPWYVPSGPFGYANTPDMYLDGWKVVDVR